jgi:hypothetical protein
MTGVRRLDIVLMTVSVVVGAVYATGAFTNLTAQRDANIQVAGDASSYLALQPASGPNGEYASLRGGKLHVSLIGVVDGAGEGVNQDALTVVRNIFTITNQGSQPIDVWLTDASERVTFRTNGTTIEGRNQAVTVRPGETLAVGLTVDTRQLTGGIDLQTMTIHAQSEAGDAGNSDGTTATAPTGQPAIEGTSGGSFLGSIPGDGIFPSISGPAKSGGFSTVATSLIPGGSTSTDDPDTYRPPTVPIEQTQISPAANAHLKESLPFAYRSRADDIIYRILKTPNVAEQYGEYRLMVGAPPQIDGWIALWVRGDTVVKIERGGYRTTRHNPPLQDPIHLTTPDGQAVTLDPAAESLTVRQPEIQYIEGRVTVDNLQQAGAPLVVGTALSDSPMIGPGDVAAVGLAVLITGAIVIDVVSTHSNSEETIHRDQETTEETQQDQQTADEDTERTQTPKKKRIPRRPPPPPDDTRVLPDGGKVEHEAMNELRRKGISQETILDWSNQGYDVVAMNEALDAYQDSGETLHSIPNSTAQGELGEIVTKQIVTNTYPSSQGYEYVQGVELKNNSHPPDIVEIDWVVVDTNTDEVAAIYQVKSDDTDEKAEEAENQITMSREAFENESVDYLDEAPSLDTDDFTENLNDIERYTIGPEKNDGPNKNPPDDYYDLTYDLTKNELKALLEAIHNNKL